MKITVANPIYDSVFKFMMEDERIARTVLSALLKKEVLTVEMRRHEHPNVTRDNLSMFRIDFAAKVRESDGSERLILIELQKRGSTPKPCVSAVTWQPNTMPRKTC